MGMVVSVSQGSSGQLWRRDLEDEGVGERGVQWLACLARGLLRRTDGVSPSHVIYGHPELWEEPGFLVCPLDFRGGSLEVRQVLGYHA